MPTKRIEDLDGSEPRDEALPILIESQADRLFSLGVRFCGNRHEAEDLVQETFLQAYRKWDGFQGHASAATWLYTIASRACQRLHRKKSGEPEHLESLDALLPFGEPRMGVVPDGRYDEVLVQRIRQEGQERIEAAIAALPVVFRMPLVLKEIVGFSVADVARILDVPGATIKTRLYRARLRIRSALERALPTADVAPAIYTRQICEDLLQAKQEALDRNVAFEFPDGIVCERCSELFATMDLAQELCRQTDHERFPAERKRALLVPST